MIYTLIFFSFFFPPSLKALTVSSIIKDCQNKKKVCTYSKSKRKNKYFLYVPHPEGGQSRFIVDAQDLINKDIPFVDIKKTNMIQSPASAVLTRDQIRLKNRKNPHPPITKISKKIKNQEVSKETLNAKRKNPHPRLVVYSRKKPPSVEKKSNHHQILSSIDSKQERDQIYSDYKLYESLDFNKNQRLNKAEIKRVLFNHFLYLNHQMKHFTKDPSKKKKYENKIENLFKRKINFKDRFYEKYKKASKSNEKLHSYYEGAASLSVDKKRYPSRNNSKDPVRFNRLLSSVLGIFQKSQKGSKRIPQIPHAASLNEDAIIDALKKHMPDITSATVSQEARNETEARDCIDCEQNKKLVNKENKNFKDQFYQCLDNPKRRGKNCSFSETNAAFFEGKHICRKHLKKLRCAKSCFNQVKDKKLKGDKKKQEFHKIVDDFYVKNKNFPSLGSRFLSCIATEKENKAGTLGLRTLVGCANDKNQNLSKNGKNFTASGLFQITKGTLKEVLEDESFWNYLDSVDPARSYKTYRNSNFEKQRDQYLNDPFLQIKAAEAVLYKKMTYVFKGSNAHRSECVDRFANNEYLKYLSLQLYHGSENKKSNQKYAKPIQSCGQKQKKFQEEALKVSKDKLIERGKNLRGKSCILRQEELKQVDFL